MLVGNSPQKRIIKRLRLVYPGNHAIIVSSVISAAIAVVLFASFTVVSALSLHTSSADAAAKILAGFTKHEITTDDYPEGTHYSRNQFNDCLVLLQAVDRDAPDSALTVSPISAPYKHKMGKCEQLLQFVRGQRPDAPTGFYNNYIHGQTPLARILLAVFPISWIDQLFKPLISLVLIFGIVVAMIDVVRGRDFRGALCILITLLVFSRWFGLEAFGQSVAHAPSDLVLLIFLDCLAIAHALGGMHARAIIPVSAIFGSATIILELLTGGVPLGIAVIIGLMPVSLNTGDLEAPTFKSAFLGVFSFLVAVVTCVLAKIVAVLWTFGPGPLSKSFDELALRMSTGSTTGEVSSVGPKALVLSIGDNMGALASGMRELALLMLVLAISAGCWGLVKMWKLPHTRDRAIACLLALSNLPLAMWVIIFSQHTIVHAWFMDRIFAWTIASGFAVFALACRRNEI
jgi:hypothetical protein